MPGLFDGTPLQRPVMCDQCGCEQSNCECPVEQSKENHQVAISKQSPRVRRERRRGKWSTVIGELPSETASLKKLLSKFQNSLGVGGGITKGEIVLQGDHRAVVVEQLCKMGYKAKASGG